MKIRFNLLQTRLTIVLLLVIILPAIIISWLAYNMMSDYIRSDRIADVGRVADIKHEQLVMVLTKANNRAQYFLSNLSAQCGGNTAKFDQVCAIGLVKAYLAAEGALGANLQRKGGGGLTIGTSAIQNEKPVTFKTGQLAKFFSTGQKSDHSYFISAADEFSGFHLSITYPSSVLEPVFNPYPPDLGLTGETFLVDGEGYFVTSPRYASTQGHDHPISARPMQSCLSGQSRTVLDLDYRGAAIIHGFHFIPELGSACIMAHITQDEGFAPLKRLKQSFVSAIFLFCVILIITAIYLARSLLKPITQITKVARAIAAGDCEAQAEAAWGDEISELVTSFNFMTHRLVQSEKMLSEAQQLAHIGSWERDLMMDSFTCSKEIFRILEIDPAHKDISYEEFILTVHPEDREMVDQAYLTCIRTREPFDIEHRLLLADGWVKWVNEHGTFFYDSNGVPLRSIGTIQDITERKLMEEDMQRSEIKFRTIYESSGDAIMLLGEKCFYDCNEATLRIFGCHTRDDFINKHPSQFSPPTQPGGQDSRRLADEHIATAFKNGSHRFEWMHCRLDGTKFPAEVLLTSTELDGRQMLQATVRDITERKRADDMLRVAATAFETHEGITITDAHGKIIRVNQAFQEITGYSQEEVLGKTPRILSSGRQDKAFYAEMWRQLLDNGSWAGEIWNKRKNGQIYPELLSITAVKDKRGETTEYVAVFNDITELKRADDMLRVAATAFETHEGIMITDAHGNIIRVNRAFQDITGYSQEEVLGKTPRILSSGRQDKAFYAAMWQQLLDTGSWAGEMWNKRKDGQIYPEWLNVTAVKDKRGETTEYVAVFRDITEHKQIEDARARFIAILEETSDLVAMADLTGHLIYMNRAGKKLLELDEAIDISKTEIADYHPKWAAEIVLREGLQTAAACGIWSGETVLLSRSGMEIPALQIIMAHKRQGDGVEYYSTVIHDISSRKRVEEDMRKYNEELEAVNRQLQDTHNQLMQSEKMASIGQLAAGVAHEINNPIGYVHSNLGTLEKYIRDVFGMIDAYEQAEGAIADAGVRARLQATRKKLDIAFLKDDLRALMDESKDGITRVKKIVQNLKDFSHIDASDEWHFTDLHNGLDSTLNIVNNEIKYKADVKKEYGDIPDVECLSSQLNQVFMNLLVNAAHAIEGRGTITLRTGQQGEEVWVEVADTGKGIAPEHISKIFDPFFTTKPVGKGTGLGLSLSYGIIQKHHGRIDVKSEVGKGTSFKVWLPVSQPPATLEPVNG